MVRAEPVVLVVRSVRVPLSPRAPGASRRDPAGSDEPTVSTIANQSSSPAVPGFAASSSTPRGCMDGRFTNDRRTEAWMVSNDTPRGWSRCRSVSIVCRIGRRSSSGRSSGSPSRRSWATGTARSTSRADRGPATRPVRYRATTDPVFRRPSAVVGTEPSTPIETDPSETRLRRRLETLGRFDRSPRVPVTHEYDPRRSDRVARSAVGQ